jgi:hypothetical protein
MDTDVFVVRVTGVVTGLLYNGRTRVRGIQFTGTGVGTLELRDGTSSGVVKMLLDVGAGVGDILIPADGLLFTTGVYVTSTGAFTSANLFCG